MFFSIRLSDSGLSSRSCQVLVPVLSSKTCSLRELDLSNNDLYDAGVTQLSAGLTSPHCRLDTLRSVAGEPSGLARPGPGSAEAFPKCAEYVKTERKAGDVEAEAGRQLSTQTQLCPCRISGCLVGERGCRSLVQALEANPGHLKELDLSFNHPGDAALQELSAAALRPHWKLETLRYSRTLETSSEGALAPSFTICDLPPPEPTTAGSAA